MKLRHLWVSGILGLAAVTAWGQGSGLDINVSNNAARVSYDSQIAYSGLDFLFQGLHNTNAGNIAGVGLGLRANANPGGAPITAILGAKALWLDPDYVGVSGGYVVALGGGVEFALPAYNRLVFGGYLYWAPNITSFSNADRYLALEARAGYRLMPNGTIYLGYRHVTARFKGTDSLVMDNGFNLGFSIRF